MINGYPSPILTHTVPKYRLGIDVRKFWPLVVLQKGQNKQCRPRSDCFRISSPIKVFPVRYSDKHSLNPSPDNKHLIWEKNEKSVRIYSMFSNSMTDRSDWWFDLQEVKRMYGTICLIMLLLREMFKKECNQLHNYLNICATTKCYTFL